ncbi:MAG: T9SS type A sorting domain-containing protein [Chitinophagaceae bacterium]|nr:T9SS type A sorting domain-containing protein [Chitinophagaceae bacterium]
MNRLLLTSLLFVLMGTNSKAQTAFTQNFSSGTDISDYIRNTTTSPEIAIGDNMFFYIGKRAPGSTVVSTTINNGKLRFARTGAAGANANHYMATAARTVHDGTNSGVQVPGGALTDGPPYPKLLKVSFEVTVADFDQDMPNVFVFSFGGAGLHPLGNSDISKTNGANHSVLGISAFADGKFKFNRPVAWDDDGSGDDPDNLSSKSYNAGSTVNVTWYINNSRTTYQNYTGPDGNTHSLDDNKYDVYVDNELILSGRTATHGSISITSFVFVLRSVDLATTGLPNNKVTVDLDNIVIEDMSSALPITLSYFKGKSTNGGNLLEWGTESESSNSHFNVLRSADGNNFYQIGKIDGKGNSATSSYYQFLDNNPNDGTNFYKLRQVDFSGKWTESDVIRVNFVNSLESNSLNAVANGNQVQIRFKAGVAGRAVIAIHDLSGRTIAKETVNTITGINTFNINVSNLPSGVYIGAVNLNDHSLKVKFRK